MPIDLSHIELNNPNPIYDQVSADVDRLSGLRLLASYSLAADAPTEVIPAARPDGYRGRRRAVSWLFGKRWTADDWCVFVGLVAALAAIDIGVVLAARG